jgi:hypothetical protein
MPAPHLADPLGWPFSSSSCPSLTYATRSDMASQHFGKYFFGRIARANVEVSTASPGT